MANEILKQVFQDMHSDIVTSVNPDSVMGALFSHEVLGFDNCCKLHQVPVSSDRCQDMMSLLFTSKHPEAFIRLRLALLDEYSWIVDEIDKKLPSLISQIQQPHLGHSTEAEKCLILPTYCNKNPLQEALIHAHLEEASQLIASQSEAQLVECFEGKDGCPKSCLHITAAISDRELATKLCRQLLQKVKNALNREYLLNTTTVEQIRGWEVNARVAAIHIAACSGNAGVVRLLCHEYGVDANCNTSETLEENPRKGITPLQLAAMEGHVEVVKALLDHGADVNAARTDTGVTALYGAAWKGHAQVVTLLLDHDADVNVRTTNLGDTALHVAAYQRQKDVAKLLVDHHANVNAKRTDCGATALYYAALEGQTETVRLLLEHHADVNARRTDMGATALHIAAQEGNAKVVKLLLDHHADMNVRTTDNGATALALAVKEGHAQVVKLLKGTRQYECKLM